MGLGSFISEWKARRAGRQSMERTDLSRAAREVVGPTGWMWSKGWEMMNEGKEAYVKSFDKRLPPSLFVSERDRTRQRCERASPVGVRCEGPTPGSDR